MPFRADSPPTLVLDASTTHGSVALFNGARAVASAQVTMGAGQEDRLFPAMQQLLEAGGLRPRDLGAVVCGAGPGSFTSLRIAAALAKGLAHGVGCPLHAVSSLLLGAASLPELPAGEYVVHADALRGERYLLPVHRDHDGIWHAAGIPSRLSAEALRVAVPGERRLAVLSSPFGDDRASMIPSATSLASVGAASWNQPVALHQWEPLYGRLAEAQVQWEQRFGVALPDAPAVRS